MFGASYSTAWRCRASPLHWRATRAGSANMPIRAPRSIGENRTHKGMLYSRARAMCFYLHGGVSSDARAAHFELELADTPDPRGRARTAAGRTADRHANLHNRDVSL